MFLFTFVIASTNDLYISTIPAAVFHAEKCISRSPNVRSIYHLGNNNILKNYCCELKYRFTCFV